jgi:hypothetical protein
MKYGERLIYVKRILGVEEYIPGIVKIRLEATKRRTLWVKILKEIPESSCESSVCPLYRDCSKLKSPLSQYPTFAEFCNRLFSDYPELKEKLGVYDINQVVPIKRIGT